MLSNKWQLKNNKYLISSGVFLAKTGDHGFRVSSHKFQDSINIVSHCRNKFFSLLVVRTFAQSRKNGFCNKCFIFYSSIFQALSVLFRQSPFSFVCLQFQWMNLNLLLICRRHLFLTLLTESILIHSFLQDNCAKYFFPQCKARTYCLLPNRDNPFRMQHLTLCEALFGSIPNSSCGQGPPLLPRQHICRLRKLSGYSRTFIPLFFVFVFHALAKRCCERPLKGSCYL